MSDRTWKRIAWLVFFVAIVLSALTWDNGPRPCEGNPFCFAEIPR